MEPVQENYYRNGPTRLLSCLPTIPAGKIGGVSQFFRNIPHYSRLYQCNPRTSPSLTASLAIIAPTRSSFYEILISQKADEQKRVAEHLGRVR